VDDEGLRMTDALRVAVVGAGAWGLPAAAELARRGHQVTLVDAFGVVNRYSSSSGATRLWRLAHRDRADVRQALASVAAWRDLEQRTGRELALSRGLLWRGDDAPAVAAALAAEGVEHVEVAAADVGRFFAGMTPSRQDAVWQPEAGPVLAEGSLLAQTELFEAAGGRLLTGWMVTAVEPLDGGGVRLLLGDPDEVTGAADGGAAASGGGSEPAELEADVAVVAAGPWAQPLLDGLGVGAQLGLTLSPQLGQVVHVTGRPDWGQLPCALDGYHEGGAGYYAMPTPGHGYKIGFSEPVRAFDPASRDREPDPAETERVVRSAGLLGFDPPVAGLAQVCSWTDSPDGEFVIDRIHDGRVVIACGDTGHGFKFSALAGLWLADLVEGPTSDPDLARFSLARFTA
jgi:sarcosine oxidase